MGLTRMQKEAKLRAAAEEMIEGMLAWDAENPTPNLTAIEEKILELRQRMGEELLAVELAGQEQGSPVEPPRCVACGEEMRAKGKKVRNLESRVGGVEVKRNYYYCVTCGQGIFPPGPTTRVRQRGME